MVEKIAKYLIYPFFN